MWNQNFNLKKLKDRENYKIIELEDNKFVILRKYNKYFSKHAFVPRASDPT